MSRTDPPAKALYEFAFGTAKFDQASFWLHVDGRQVKLERRPLEVLELLLEYAGEVVTREEFFETVWDRRPTVDGVLSTAVSRLRKALGPANARFIKSRAGLGYAFVGPLRKTAVGRPQVSRLDLQAGQAVPGRSDLRLQTRLRGSASKEVWIARGQSQAELRVFKFCLDRDGLLALKREATLSQLLERSLGPRADFARVVGRNLSEAPFYIECQYGGSDLLCWSREGDRLRAMSRNQRLSLFLQIVDAVAAAHSVGILHKDLKPANVLIREEGGQLRICLSDLGSGRVFDQQMLKAFGVSQMGASLAADELTGPTGTTLLYMAPELGEGHSATLQTDVYALGLMLYQVLAGDLKRPMSTGWEQQIDDELLVDDIRAATAGNPEARLKSAAELAHRLRELPDRRADLVRRQADEHRARAEREALARSRARRPWLIAAIASMLVALVGTSTLYRAASVARDEVRQQARRAEATNRFWNREIIESGNPYLNHSGGVVLIETVLDGAAARLPAAFADAPATAASIHETLGAAFESQTRYERAITQYRTARDLYASAFGANSGDAVRAEFHQARAHALASQFDEAQRILDSRPLPENTDEWPADVTFAANLAHATLLTLLQKWSPSLPYYEDALRASESTDVSPSLAALVTIRTADAYERVARLDESEALLRNLLEHGRDVPPVLQAYARLQLGTVMLDRDRLDEAEPLLLGAHDELVGFLGEKAFLVLLAKNLLTNLYMWTDRLDQAVPYARAAHRLSAESLGEDHNRTLSLKANYGLMLRYAGANEDALQTMASARNDLVAQIGSEAPYVHMLGYYIAETLADLGRTEEARVMLASINAAKLDAAQIGLGGELRLQVLEALLDWMRPEPTVTAAQLESFREALRSCDCSLMGMVDRALEQRELRAAELLTGPAPVP